MSRHEKSKSGSKNLFETMFSKSTKRQHNSQQNGKSRPVSANENENEHVDIDVQILRLTVEEINKKFNEIVDDMNLNAEKRAPLMMKTMEERREMIKMHLKGSYSAYTY